MQPRAWRHIRVDSNEQKKVAGGRPVRSRGKESSLVQLMVGDVGEAWGQAEGRRPGTRPVMGKHLRSQTRATTGFCNFLNWGRQDTSSSAHSLCDLRHVSRGP